MGAPALTSRGFLADDFRTVVDLFDKGVQIALDVKAQGGKLKDFRQKITEGENAAAIEALKKDVSAFASGFPQVGVPDRVARVLTSGGQPTAMQGAAMVRGAIAATAVATDFEPFAVEKSDA